MRITELPDTLPSRRAGERPWEYLKRIEHLVQRTGRIPQIVHQTWKTMEVPDKWRTSPVGWQCHHPSWAYVLWTDEDNREYIRRFHPHFLKIFDEYEYPIQRADAIRYFMLRDFGGVYSDLDLEMRKSICDYIDKESIYLLFSPNMPCFTNYLMASREKEPLWDRVIERLSNPDMPWWSYSTKHTVVMYSTGPAMLNDVVNQYPHSVGLLPRAIFAPVSLDDDVPSAMNDSIESKKDVLMGRRRGIRQQQQQHGNEMFRSPADIGGNNVVRVLEGQSWNSLDSTFFNFCFRYRTALIILAVCVFFGALVATFIMRRQVVIMAAMLQSSKSNVPAAAATKQISQPPAHPRVHAIQHPSVQRSMLAIR